MATDSRSLLPRACVTVIDFGQYTAGPAVAMILADLSANWSASLTAVSDWLRPTHSSSSGLATSIGGASFLVSSAVFDA